MRLGFRCSYKYRIIATAGMGGSCGLGELALLFCALCENLRAPNRTPHPRLVAARSQRTEKLLDEIYNIVGVITTQWVDTLSVMCITY
jgi:hypothetical protein